MNDMLKVINSLTVKDDVAEWLTVICTISLDEPSTDEAKDFIRLLASQGYSPSRDWKKKLKALVLMGDYFAD